MDEPSTEFDAFYAGARDRLAVQIAALSGDPAEALDHVQEAFVRAWSRWSRVGQLDDPEGWVRRVAYNLAVSRWRRARRTILRSGSTETGFEWDDTQLQIVLALRALPHSERAAIVLHHLADLPVDEVATLLGVPPGTVKSWLHRGRAHLGARLATDMADGTATEPAPVRTEEELTS